MKRFFGSVVVREDHQTELEYYIQESSGSYGIEIRSSSPLHSGFAAYGNVTSSLDEITNFVECLMENSAYPENLSDYVEDFLYEKAANEAMGTAVIHC